MNEYTLGEPLTEATEKQRYIAVCNATGQMRQSQFTPLRDCMSPLWTYYADPRPLPTLPEPKEEQIPILAWVGHNRYQLTSEGAARLERLLRKEGE